MNPTRGKRAIILGVNDRAMFSLARQLLKKDFSVEVAGWENIDLERSRYIDRYHRLSNAEKDVQGFVSELLELLEENSYTCLIPVNDAALEICVGFAEEISKRVNIVGLPGPEYYIFSHDKAAVLERCVEIGLPTLKFRIVRQLEGAEELLKDFAYPLVIKPAFSKLIKDNRLYSFSVKTVHDRIEAIDVIREHIENCHLIVQEYIAGYGAGFNFLAKDGEIFSQYAHERVLEPFEGGQSSYRKTISSETYNLLEYSKLLVKNIRWSGVAMVEYRISGGTPYLMEINGRLWGSIELGIFAGINIPRQMIEFFLEGRIPTASKARSVSARNLKLDIVSVYRKVTKRRSLSPIAEWARSLGNIFSKNEIVEDNPIRDVLYELSIYRLYMEKAFKIVRNKIMSDKKVIVKKRLPRMKKGAKIGYLCYGNICRSPFAELYAKSRFEDFQFSSFGFYPQSGRMSPTFAVDAAAGFQVDLDKHRSRLITEEYVRSLDVVLVMDRKNYSDFAINFPNDTNKLFYLDPERDIEDPYHHGQDYFSTVYMQVAESIDKLLVEND